MPDIATEWRPVGAWSGLASDTAHHGRGDIAPGVTVTLIDHVDMATLIAGVENERFAGIVRDLWGLDVPAAGRVSRNDACTLLWSGPGQWLAIPRSYDPASLVAAFANVAAASEQGDGRALLEVGGPAARDVLAKGFAIDLHPSAFTPGSVAVTALSHLSVQIWLTDDAPTYILSVPRTTADHVWHWLLDSAAEYGCAIKRRAGL